MTGAIERWLLAGLMAGQGFLRAEELEFHWFTVRLEVRGVPREGEFLPVSVPVDFGGLLRGTDVAGAVDERTIELRDLLKASDDVSVQFGAYPQLRPENRPTSSGLPPKVSYVAEYKAGEVPKAPVEGELSWIVRGSVDGMHPYQLRFGVRKRGTLIQVPFPPQNLRGFDRFGKATRVRGFPVMQLHPQWPFAGEVSFFEGQQLVTTYRLGSRGGDVGSSLRRPCFYPVIGPDGIGLTEFGKPHDPTGSHAHHYSLWVAHAQVNGHDFWSERGGTIEHEQLELMEDGPVFASIVQRNRWVRDGAAVLRERRMIRVYEAGDGFRILDVTLEFEPPEGQPVEFGRTTFGFLAARVAQSMTVFDGGGMILNSEGDLNELGAHLERGKWIDQSGPIAPGRWGGIAILDHPDNENHPTVWHCRNDGWAGASFNGAAAYRLEPGKKLQLKYRVHLHRGDATAGKVAQRFIEFSARPEVNVGSVKREENPEREERP